MYPPTHVPLSLMFAQASITLVLEYEALNSDLPLQRGKWKLEGEVKEEFVLSRDHLEMQSMHQITLYL